jgi:diaminopimelate decarboxylase
MGETSMVTPIPDQLARLLPENSAVNDAGEFTIGGCSLPQLAEQFGTPAYVFDELGMRDMMRRYRNGLAARWQHSRVCFASKALPCIAAYAIAAAEGLSIDVAGEGELRLALAAGVAPSTIVLHGNAKSISELELATRVGVGLIVVDNFTDIDMLEQLAPRSQDVLIRVKPGIIAHTHPSISTGGQTSKFGIPLTDIPRAVERLRGHPSLRMRGVHVHIGSQIQELSGFTAAVEALAQLGQFDVYDFGGGLGVNHTADDNAPSVEDYLDAVVNAARRVLPDHAEILLEPGRSLVARSGATAYTVRNIKKSHLNFVAVDGGMSDQLNIALTDDRYTAVIANRIASAADTVAQLVGRQCESGDLLVEQAHLPSPQRGDTVVLATTGAYGYTFANNYNGALHPPVIFCKNGSARLAVQRQSYDDLLRPHAPALSADWSE